MKERDTWPYTGCLLPGYPKLNPSAAGFWPKFWRLYAHLRQPHAGDILRPPGGCN
jgi:hypothetical protein